MSRARAAALLFLLLCVGVGCASPDRKTSEAKMHLFEAEAIGVRHMATAVGANLGMEADTLDEARRANREPAIDLAMERLRLGHLLLESIEEAEITFAIAHKFYDLHDSLDLPPKIIARLEADVGKMVEVARRAALRVKEYVHGSGSLGRDLPSLERLRREIERDRAGLKAYRTDVALVTRIGVR